MRWVGLVGLAIIIGLVWLVLQAVSSTPAVLAPPPPSASELEQGWRVYRHLNPAGLRDGLQRQVVLSARQMALGLNALLQRSDRGQGRVTLAGQSVAIDVSLRLPKPLDGLYLNATGIWSVSDAGLNLSGVKLGQVSLPAFLVTPLTGVLRHRLPYAPLLAALGGMIQSAHVGNDQLALNLVWDQERAVAAMDLARERLTGVTTEQSAAYRNRLVQSVSSHHALRIADILGDLFSLARTRSLGGDPIAENRALLVMLAEAVNGDRLGLLNTGSGQPSRLRLAGREDFIQHFTLSASLAAVAGEGVADRAGLYKELRDTEAGGSGFSFTDLAADRAGARFGQAATASAEQARRMQERLTARPAESSYLPVTHDLPEFLPRQVFDAQYGGVAGEGYRRWLGEIDRRISALPLYKQP